MPKEMLINVSEGEECRIALVEDGRLEELYMERTSSTSHVGNVYKGRVTNVEPSIQAAFIDFGLGRNGFLHISDLMPTYFGGKAEGERKPLRQILDSLKPPKECGFIIRTAGVGKSKAEIERDLKYLTRLFETINKKAKSSGDPMELYAEGDLVTRTVRDVMTSDVERIVVDNEDVAKKIKEFCNLVAA